MDICNDLLYGFLVGIGMAAIGIPLVISVQRLLDRGSRKFPEVKQDNDYQI